MTIKVLHLPRIIANSSAVLSRALNRMGIESTTLSNYASWLGYQGDINLNLDGLDERESSKRRQEFSDEFFSGEASHYDIFHYHFFEPLASYEELKTLRAMGKKVVVTAYGSDVRNPSKLLYYQLKFEDPSLDLPPPPLNTVGQVTGIVNFAQQAHLLLTASSELQKHLPLALTVPCPIDIEMVKGCDSGPSPNSTETFSILHAPSNTFVKGTRFILPVLERIRGASKVDVEIRLIQGVPYQEALKHYPGLGVAVDQINVSFGLFALEAMCFGRPVFCSLQPKEFPQGAHELLAPVQSVASAQELYEGILAFIEEPDRVGALREVMEQYVREFHSVEVVASRLKVFYERLMDGEDIPMEISSTWLEENRKLSLGEEVGQGYYPRVTDILLKKGDLKALLREVRHGLGLGNEMELLAKGILAHEQLGRKELAAYLRRANAPLVEGTDFRHHYNRAQELFGAQRPEKGHTHQGEHEGRDPRATMEA